MNTALQPLLQLDICASWVPRDGAATLEVAALMSDGDQVIGLVTPGRPVSPDGAIQRPEDAAGRLPIPGLDQLTVNLTRVDPATQSIFIAVYAPGGQPLRRIEGFRFLIMGDAGPAHGAVIQDVRTITTGEYEHDGLLAGEFYRSGGTWDYRVIMRTAWATGADELTDLTKLAETYV